MPPTGKPRPIGVSKIGRKPSPIGKRPIGKLTYKPSLTGKPSPTPAGAKRGTPKPIKSLARERAAPPPAEGRFIREAKAKGRSGDFIREAKAKGRVAKRAAPMSREELRFIGEAKAGAKRGSRFDRPGGKRPSVFASTGGPTYPLTTKAGVRSRRWASGWYGKAGIPNGR